MNRTASLLLSCLLLLLPSCTASPTPEEAKAEVVAIAMAVGDALLRTDVTDWLKQHYPDLFPIIDTVEDGVITLDEIKALNPAEPKVWVAILFALRARHQ